MSDLQVNWSIWSLIVLAVLEELLLLKNGHFESSDGKQQNISILALLLRRTSKLMRDVTPKSVVTKTNKTNMATCKQNPRNAGIGTKAAVRKIDIVMKDVISIFVPVFFNTKPTSFFPI